MKSFLRSWYHSFPIQLVILHLKSNLFLLSIWCFFLMIGLGWFGKNFGIMYLVLTPEYLGEVDFFSFCLVGLAFGGFLVTWNISTYILHSPQFPFLASLKRPFAKFFLNNSLIPLTFLVILVWKMIDFQWFYEVWDGYRIFMNVMGFVFGIGATLIMTAMYFMLTNKDIFNYVKSELEMPPNLDKPVMPGNRAMTMAAVKKLSANSRVKSYLNESFRWRPVRDVSHYEEENILNVFRQNHVNAIVVQSVSIVLLITMGYLIENPYFRIPAAASFFILASVIVSVAGVVSYWLHKWTNLFVILLILGINFITKFDSVDYTNKAYGLDYSRLPAEYSLEDLRKFQTPELIQKDKEATIRILENWKKKNKGGQLSGKPKLVIVCTSGGGMRASLWTTQVFQQLSQETNDRFLERTALITGASGGMIGAGYYRELYRRKVYGDTIDLYHKSHIDNISKEMLNSLAFTVVSNDIFLPWGRFEDNGMYYPKDRGYIFEWQMNKNLGGILDVRIKDYAEPEQKADVPMMFFTPALANDGRKMIISPQGVSYMTQPPHGVHFPEEIGYDGIDFGRMFSDHKPYDLKLTSAIRANASFPFILPNVVLPSEPRIELVDAGFMDNRGMGGAFRFVNVFRDWIKKNTGGVVFVLVNGNDPTKEKNRAKPGFIDSFTNPLGVMGNIVDIQDYEQDVALNYVIDLLGDDFVEFVPFTYIAGDGTYRASMSLRLTEREKIDVINAYYNKENQESLRRLKKLLR